MLVSTAHIFLTNLIVIINDKSDNSYQRLLLCNHTHDDISDVCCTDKEIDSFLHMLGKDMVVHNFPLDIQFDKLKENT